jgi:hypothetical protein
MQAIPNASGKFSRLLRDMRGAAGLLFLNTAAVLMTVFIYFVFKLAGF